jgi:hypothetical protein
MPSELSHLGVANDNHTTLAFLLQDVDTHLPWIGTIAFYKALHIVEAALDTSFSTHLTDHTSRLRFLAKENRLKKVYEHYHPLYSMSQKARYLSNGSSMTKFADHVTSKQMIDTYLKHHLHQVEQASLKLMTPAANLKLVTDLSI